VLEYILIGGGFALAAVLQPGPLQAYLLSSVMQRGWRRTLPACLAPLLSDGPIIVLALLVLTRISTELQMILRFGGGLLLLYLAWTSFQHWKHGIQQDAAQTESAPRTLLQAVMVNLLNPNPYLAWSLVLGPAVVDAWEKNHAFAIAIIAAFYATMVVGLAGTIFLLGTTTVLSPRSRRVLVLISALILAILGIYQLVVGFYSVGLA
jgi:threonine/homoserine/homoserine lactone efflux protein